MPKLKTSRSAKKRFRKTGTGKVRRNQAFKNHILTKKTTKRKRALRKGALVNPSDLKRIKRMLLM
jgi:large subunit ribosomal protein L35